MPVPHTTLPATLTMREARDEYLRQNGFTLESYTSPWVPIRFLGILWSFPNSPARQRVVPFHDLHHVVTGFGTDWVGESEQGAWEVAAGCTVPIAYYLNTMAALVGCCLAPRRVWRAFQLGRSHGTLYRRPIPYDQVLAMTLGELRAHLDVPATGVADHPSRVHADAPKVVDYQRA